mmetsp:Transcript_7982/g.12345  ORF Transcript_7982/g.12345 Transcript_7982/m.12345 type:complete len:95 (-) Transcript_7982:364-648(-)
MAVHPKLHPVDRIKIRQKQVVYNDLLSADQEQMEPKVRVVDPKQGNPSDKTFNAGKPSKKEVETIPEAPEVTEVPEVKDPKDPKEKPTDKEPVK